MLAHAGFNNFVGKLLVFGGEFGQVALGPFAHVCIFTQKIVVNSHLRYELLRLLADGFLAFAGFHDDFVTGAWAAT